MHWDGMILKNEKNDIIAAIIKGKEISAVVYRNKSYIQFDGFVTIDEARKFCEKAER